MMARTAPKPKTQPAPAPAAQQQRRPALEIAIPLAPGGTVRLDLTEDIVNNIIGRALASPEPIAPDRMFELPAPISISNPSAALRRTGDDTFALAIQGANLFPIMLYYTTEAMRGLRDALSSALGDKGDTQAAGESAATAGTGSPRSSRARTGAGSRRPAK